MDNTSVNEKELFIAQEVEFVGRLDNVKNPPGSYEPVSSGIENVVYALKKRAKGG